MQSSRSPELKVLSTLALMVAIKRLTPDYARLAGSTVLGDFAPTKALMSRLSSGETADVVILTDDAARHLLENSVLVPGSVKAIATSYVGMAVKEGATKPDLSSIEACRRALLSARSICYSKIGVSGSVFAALVERLGIREEVEAKATVLPTGLTAELAARGDVDVAVQQVSELMAVPGVAIVGSFPHELQDGTSFSAGILNGSPQIEAAQQFVRYLRSSAVAAVLKASGLEPMVG